MKQTFDITNFQTSNITNVRTNSPLSHHHQTPPKHTEKTNHHTLPPPTTVFTPQDTTQTHRKNQSPHTSTTYDSFHTTHVVYKIANTIRHDTQFSDQ
ncbi:hypothetical protein WH47_12609 [Habropoda laboriosa]|uniref:Uncharacterized protein n=1 Tax=Habropoda laboriosa TaxID=597456 RepID=A0A0L7R7I3_9HYME|nr:hypothetical protein WH47_12609 [Habropoda laboriosa]